MPATDFQPENELDEELRVYIEYFRDPDLFTRLSHRQLWQLLRVGCRRDVELREAACRHLKASEYAPTGGALRFAEWVEKKIPDEPDYKPLRSAADRATATLRAHFQYERSKRTLLRPSAHGASGDELLRPTARQPVSSSESLLRTAEVDANESLR